ncbi:hypothetical protein BABINDRAFT_159342 [Babjeviella inositovora NRRL Y-12698]|uniref:Uncharacterized protein n=1 Tax=Babjeviella inositovora NRRL Y-12698 TaxID=984486 RepID=A0A1E3QZ04_9ASCO|nr:uncharacterized protein BABINDRAFT_159342 [Babjeviella inositovora NRRL Y-12698]ODQ82845.1 hypothetical protein BABINDRAFT_159342 [Babjeviella inositovora NRRL Y-12698]
MLLISIERISDFFVYIPEVLREYPYFHLDLEHVAYILELQPGIQDFGRLSVAYVL